MGVGTLDLRLWFIEPVEQYKARIGLSCVDRTVDIIT